MLLFRLSERLLLFPLAAAASLLLPSSLALTTAPSPPDSRGGGQAVLGRPSAPADDHDGVYQSVRLPEFPGHVVRIKEQIGDDICDAGSKQYIGWLDVGGKHLFFWYVESLRDPVRDPLNLWMTGGPGCSGLIGMMLELGPCLVNEGAAGTRRNPYSWTRHASMIFIDQPAGTGYSYVDDDDDKAEGPADSPTAAVDVYVFLRLFYAAFPHLRAVPLHISGESYGGHYVPAVATEILRRNRDADADAEPTTTIPLTSLAIGDGLVDPLATLHGYYGTLCTALPGLAAPVFNATRCAALAAALPRCDRLHRACYAYPDPVLCRAADAWCGAYVRDLFMSEAGVAGGRDPFDVTRVCEVDQLCYRAVLDIERYARSPAVRAALDVPAGVNFSIYDLGVHEAFMQGVDPYVSMVGGVKEALEAGVDVLVYNGNWDLACNTAGNLRWADAMAWAGQAELAAKSLEPWYYYPEAGRGPEEGEGEEEEEEQELRRRIPGARRAQQAGTAKEVTVLAAPGNGKPSRFAFVTFDRSGHMVPLDQPEAALHLIETWMRGGEL